MPVDPLPGAVVVTAVVVVKELDVGPVVVVAAVVVVRLEDVVRVDSVVVAVPGIH